MSQYLTALLDCHSPGGRQENKQTRHQHHRPRLPTGSVQVTGRKLLIACTLLQRLHATQRQRTGLQVSCRWETSLGRTLHACTAPHSKGVNPSVRVRVYIDIFSYFATRREWGTWLFDRRNNSLHPFNKFNRKTCIEIRMVFINQKLWPV